MSTGLWIVVWVVVTNVGIIIGAALIAPLKQYVHYRRTFKQAKAKKKQANLDTQARIKVHTEEVKTFIESMTALLSQSKITTKQLQKAGSIDPGMDLDLEDISLFKEHEEMSYYYGFLIEMTSKIETLTQAVLSDKPDNELLYEIRLGIIKLARRFDSSKLIEYFAKVGFDLKSQQRDFKICFEARYKQLVADAPGSLQSFSKLEQLRIDLNERQPELQKVLEWANIDPVYMPPNWNQLVVQHYEVPAWSQFMGLTPFGDLQTGRLRLWAAEAIRKNDFVKAQMVLSYTNKWTPQVQIEIGEIMMADLAKLVVVHQATPKVKA